MNALSIIFTASILLSVLFSADGGPPSNLANYSIELKMKDAVAFPVVCRGRKQGQPGWDRRTISVDGRVDISVLVKNAEGIPLNYDYQVTGGRIIGQGPEVKWDLLGATPGDYSVTVSVDDGVGNTGRIVKTIRVLESNGCPCVCPAVYVVSHFSQIKPGETLDFEVWVHGGDFEREIEYHWTVERGSILSGQNSPSIEVRANDSLGEMVTATVEIGGIGRSCNCPHTAAESVRIGSETKTVTTPLNVTGLHIEGTTLYVDCPRGSVTSKDSRTSEDLIAEVNIFAISNSVRDKLSYRYAVTGGEIIGSGPRVNWDLTGFQPGTYSVTVKVDDGTTNPPAEKKVDVTLAERQCTSLCPDAELSTVRTIKGSADVIVSANIDAPPETKLIWSTNGATIVAGQGSRSVRLRPAKENATVTLNLEPLGGSACPRVYSCLLKPSVAESDRH